MLYNKGYDMKKFRIKILSILFGMLLLCFGSITVFADSNKGMDDFDDGEYSISVDIEGGSGKASVSSPTLITIIDSQMFAKLIWSSENYDYMIVDGTKYDNLSEEGANSSFEVPVSALDEPIEVIADTTAMGTPHEITYYLTFHSDTIDSKSALPQEAAKRVVIIALVIIIGGGVLNAFVKKKLRG